MATGGNSRQPLIDSEQPPVSSNGNSRQPLIDSEQQPLIDSEQPPVSSNGNSGGADVSSNGNSGRADVKGGLLTVAVLIATATYQRGLSPPGGVWGSDIYSQNGTLIAPAGTSIMGTRDEGKYIEFMVGNAFGFYVSLFIILCQTIRFPHYIELILCILALGISYQQSVYTISPTISSEHFWAWLSLAPPGVVIFMSLLVRASRKLVRTSQGSLCEESASAKRFSKSQAISKDIGDIFQ